MKDKRARKHVADVYLNLETTIGGSSRADPAFEGGAHGILDQGTLYPGRGRRT